MVILFFMYEKGHCSNLVLAHMCEFGLYNQLKIYRCPSPITQSFLSWKYKMFIKFKKKCVLNKKNVEIKNIKK